MRLFATQSEYGDRIAEAVSIFKFIACFSSKKLQHSFKLNKPKDYEQSMSFSFISCLVDNGEAF